MEMTITEMWLALWAFIATCWAVIQKNELNSLRMLVAGSVSYTRRLLSDPDFYMAAHDAYKAHTSALGELTKHIEKQVNKEMTQ